MIILQGDAVCSDDCVYVVRVLSIQTNVCCSSFRVVSNSSASASASANGGTNHNNHSSSDSNNSNSANMNQKRKAIDHGDNGTGGNSHGSTNDTSSSTSIAGSIGSSIMSGFGMLSGGNDSNESHNNNNHHHHHHETHKKTIMGMTMGKSSGGYSSSTGKTGRTLKEDEALSIRILQILTMIVDSRTLELTEEVLSQCLAICFTFIAATSGGGGSGGSSGSAGSNSIITSGKKGGTSAGSGIIGSNSSNSINVKGSMDYEKGKTKNSTFVGGDCAKKVKRAAIATLRQIISIVFDRAATETLIPITTAHHQEDIDHFNKEKKMGDKQPQAQVSMSVIASRLFLDLCDLAEFGSGINATKDNLNNLESQLKERGPFSQALLGGGIGYQRMNPPPRSVCFDLLEMIISQQVELFTTQSGTEKVSKDDDDDDDDDDISIRKPDFSLLLRNRLCPVLSNMLTTEFVTGLDSTDEENPRITNNRRRHHHHHHDSTQRRMVGDNPASFALLMTLIKLAATIITEFGTKTSLASSLDSECHVLIVSLLKYVKAATELIRDSHDFEVILYACFILILQFLQPHVPTYNFPSNPFRTDIYILITQRMKVRILLQMQVQDMTCLTHLHTFCGEQQLLLSYCMDLFQNNLMIYLHCLHCETEIIIYYQYL